MAYRSRYARRVARKSRANFLVTLIIIVFLGYASLQWILPNLVGGIGFVKGLIKPSAKTSQNLTADVTLAPPVLNIPYEATNTAQIDIGGYGNPHSKVSLYLDDDKVDTTQVQDDGTFVVKNVSLKLGTNNIYGKSEGDNNKESFPSKTIQLIFDNEKPSLDISSPSDGQTVQGGDKKITINGKTEPEAQVMINNNRVVLDKDGNFSSTQDLNDGDNNFTIRATDKAGNYTEVARKVTYKSS